MPNWAFAILVICDIALSLAVLMLAWEQYLEMRTDRKKRKQNENT